MIIDDVDDILVGRRSKLTKSLIISLNEEIVFCAFFNSLAFTIIFARRNSNTSFLKRHKFAYVCRIELNESNSLYLDETPN